MPGPSEAADAAAQPLIHARGLTKRFGDFTAVDGIDFDVARRRVVRVPGAQRRGQDDHDADDRLRLAGDRRHARVLGHGPRRPTARAIRARLGVVPQQDSLDMELTVEENLLIYGRYFDLSYREARRAGRGAARVRPAGRARERPGRAAVGRHEAAPDIARGLINQPDLLLLDEPTTGLDPQARHLLWDRLYRLKQQGVTLILTTHYMDEAEQLCDRLVVMDKARIVAEGSPRALIEQHATKEVLELRFRPEELATLDGRLDGLASASSTCPTGCCCTPPTAMPRRWRSTSAACGPRACWSAGARSRTCSCD